MDLADLVPVFLSMHLVDLADLEVVLLLLEVDTADIVMLISWPLR